MFNEIKNITKGIDKEKKMKEMVAGSVFSTALLQLNRIPAIRVFAVRVTPIFTNKKHALNTLKMGLLLS
jgi:hypothetical protein